MGEIIIRHNYLGIIFLKIFSQVDEEVNRFMIFDEMVDYRVGGTYTMQKDAFIVSNNGGYIGR